VVDGEVLDRDLLIAVDAGRFHFEFDQLAKIGQRVIERCAGLQRTGENRCQDLKTQASTAGNQGGEGV
jgi:hypothetical protein